MCSHNRIGGITRSYMDKGRNLLCTNNCRRLGAKCVVVVTKNLLSRGLRLKFLPLFMSRHVGSRRFKVRREGFQVHLWVTCKGCSVFRSRTHNLHHIGELRIYYRCAPVYICSTVQLVVQ